MKKYVIFVIIIFATMLNATNRADSLQSILDTSIGEERLDILIDISKEYLYSYPNKTISYAEEARDLAIQLNNKEREILAIISIGSGYLFMGEFDKAKEQYLTKTLEMSKEIDYKDGISGSLNSLAAIALNKGDYDLAMDLFLQTHDVLKETNDTERIATVNTNIASLYVARGLFSKALEYYLESLKIFEEIGKIDLVGMSYNNIAVTYHNWGDLDKALDYYFRANDTMKMNGDIQGTAIPLNNIGEIYKDKGEYKLALKYYFQSLKISESVSNWQHTSVAALGMGEAYKELEDYEQAMSYTDKALEIFNDIGYMEGIARAENNLAEIYMSKRQYQTAIEHLNITSKLAEKNRIKDIMKISYKNYARIYEKMKNYRKSLLYFKRYSALKDSMFTETNSEKIAQLQIVYDTERKEKENQLLLKENEINLLEIKKQENLRNYTLIITLLIIILSILIYSKYHMKQRANKILASKNDDLESLNKELEKALEEVNQLSGLLPICSHCKSIRDDQGYWNKIETYIKDHSDAKFSHSVCPDCMKKIYPEIKS